MRVAIVIFNRNLRKKPTLLLNVHITLHNANFTLYTNHLQGRQGEMAVSAKGKDQAYGFSQRDHREGLWPLGDHFKYAFSHTAETSHNINI